MKYIYDYSNFSIMMVENLFLKEEVKQILDECNYINKYVGLQTPEKTGTAYDENMNAKRKSSSIFLDSLVTQEGRNMSSILRIMDSKLYSTDFIQKFIEMNPFNLIITNTKFHSTLLNYYEEKDHYHFHKDNNVFTILHILYEEPKSFEGGDIVFRVNDNELPVQIKNNLSIIFPAAYDHMVTSVSMKENNSDRMMGRFSFAQFLDISNPV